MNIRCFIDTNVFVYSFDANSALKRKKAQEIIQSALSDHQGIISYQVVQEFMNVATRKFLKPLSLRDCELYLDEVLAPLCEVYASVELYKRALDVAEGTGYSFYDSLIVASAIEGHCRILYSEDLQEEQNVQGVTIRNPF